MNPKTIQQFATALGGPTLTLGGVPVDDFEADLSSLRFGTLAAASLSFDGTQGVAALVPPSGVRPQTLCGFAVLPEIMHEYNVLVGGADSLAVYVYTGGRIGVAKSGMTDLGTVDATFPLNRWAFFAATYDGAEIRIYIAGAFVGSIPAAGVVFDGEYLILGADSATGNQPIRVKLARVSRLNFALSAAEIAQLHADLGVLPPELRTGSSHFIGDLTLASAGSLYYNSLRGVNGQRTSLTVTAPAGSDVYCYMGGTNRLVGIISGGTTATLSTTYLPADSGWGLVNVGVGTATYTGIELRNFGALYIQPDADAGAGPVLLGEYGNPDTVLPGDGHTYGGVYRSASAERGIIKATRTESGYLLGNRRIIPPGYGADLVGISAETDGSVSVGTSPGNASYFVGDATPGENGATYLPASSTSADGKVYAALTDTGTATVCLHISRR